MHYLLKDSVFCILAWLKSLLNLLPKKALMLLCLRDSRFKDFHTSILDIWL